MIISDVMCWVIFGVAIVLLLGAFVLGAVFGQLSTKAELFGDTLAELGRRNREMLEDGLTDDQIKHFLKGADEDDG